VLARQPDGIHFTYGGSVFPAWIILRALEQDFGKLGQRPGLPAGNQ
jgi:hypothetical protein